MRQTVSAVVAVLVALATFGVSETAAFVQERTDGTEAGFHWRVLGLQYAVHEDGVRELGDVELMEAVHASYNAWAAVGCLDFDFQYAGRTSARAVGFDESQPIGSDNIVVWQERPADWAHALNVIAMTNVVHNVATGEIVDADIEFNAISFCHAIDGDPNCMDVQNTLTHELGHLMGLGHTIVPGATMAARAPTGETDKRSLEEDDIDGVCAIYGPDPGVCVEDENGLCVDRWDAGADGGGGGGCAAGGSPAPWGAALLIALAGLAFVARRRAGALALVVGLSVLGLGATPAAAWIGYETSGGLQLAWPSQSVPYWIDAEGSTDVDAAALEAVVASSFAEWARPDCTDLTFPAMGRVEGGAAGFDPAGENLNVLVWIPSGWSHGARVVALTSLVWDDTTGVIVDSDIEFNDEEFDFSASDELPNGAMDLKNALTHEIGHLLGFDHNPLEETTMYLHAPPGDIAKRDLHEDDIDGLCTVYPTAGAPVGDAGSGGVDGPDVDGGTDGPPNVDPDGDDGGGGCAADTRGTSPFALLPWLLATALILLRIRNRDSAVQVSRTATRR